MTLAEFSCGSCAPCPNLLMLKILRRTTLRFHLVHPSCAVMQSAQDAQVPHNFFLVNLVQPILLFFNSLLTVAQDAQGKFSDF